MRKPALAIVIPAYKATYLERTLKSLEAQTCKDFNVYVGDDNSPYHIKDIIERFTNSLNLFYYQFEDNLGGCDLVGQWKRCIDLSKGEEWLWLFSDDDEMEERCVELFYETINTGVDFDLYHFDVIPIDKQSDASCLKKLSKRPFKKILSSKDFVLQRLKYQINSFVVEFIFSRKAYEENGGFQNFDMAWGTDDATWAKLSTSKGIYTIDGAKVRWRYSGDNITSIESADVMRRKGYAVVKLLSYYDTLFKDVSLNKWYFNYYLHMIYNVMKSCEWKDVKQIISLYKKDHTDLVPFWVWKLIHKITKIK